MTLEQAKYVCQVCGELFVSLRKRQAVSYTVKFCSAHRHEAARNRFNCFTDKTKKKPVSGADARGSL